LEGKEAFISPPRLNCSLRDAQIQIIMAFAIWIKGVGKPFRKRDTYHTSEIQV